MKLFVPYFMYKNLLQKYNDEKACHESSFNAQVKLTGSYSFELEQTQKQNEMLRKDNEKLLKDIWHLRNRITECNQRRIELIEQYDRLREKAAKAGVWE